MKYDDLLRGSEAFVRKLYQLVGVDETFVPNVTQRDHSGQLQLNSTSRRLLTKAKQVDSFLKPLFSKSITAWGKRNIDHPKSCPKAQNVA